ncbi:hypothetical protein VMCG_07586 [Cytospora schulzeri]|uniref:NADP-dependent oxidoreductase domain-containing protein n=1 Tax=Cytospora schulzeri TaxID=448051 RepID=A0A423VXG2_9PEZI|nr:hypothetical protein VMCG_07586 [Valsa malicola]
MRDHERDTILMARAEGMARDRDVSLLAVALAYVMQKTTYMFPIVGGRQVKHLQGMIDALIVALMDEEIDKVESAYEFDAGLPHTFLSGTMFQDGMKPIAAQAPGDVWLTKQASDSDWVETPKALRLDGDSEGSQS